MAKWLNGFRFDKDLWDPSHRFETSWLLPPWALFVCRALISIFVLATRFFLIGFTCSNDEYGGCADAGRSFSYFTILTFWGIGFYFAFAALHTGTYAFRGRPLLDSWPRPLQALHALFYTTIVVYPFIVTIVYWVILDTRTWADTQVSAFSNISQHALNSAFALFEVVVPRTSHDQMRPVHMLWVVIILALYLSLAYLTHAVQGFYVYPFLDPDNGSGLLAGYILGIAAAGIIIYGIVKGVVWVRQWLTERVLGMDGKFAGRPAYGNDSEMGTMHHDGHYVKPHHDESMSPAQARDMAGRF